MSLLTKTDNFLDGYYNKAIAASPVHAFPGYILGGLSWFAIPWLTATTMGLSALALESVSARLSKYTYDGGEKFREILTELEEPCIPYLPGPHVERRCVCRPCASLRSRGSPRQRRSDRNLAHRLHGCHISAILRAHCSVVDLHL